MCVYFHFRGSIFWQLHRTAWISNPTSGFITGICKLIYTAIHHHSSWHFYMTEFSSFHYSWTLHWGAHPGHGPGRTLASDHIAVGTFDSGNHFWNLSAIGYRHWSHCCIRISISCWIISRSWSTSSGWMRIRRHCLAIQIQKLAVPIRTGLSWKPHPKHQQFLCRCPNV